MSRILGLDYGERRIGVARSDPTGFFATALCVLDARSNTLFKEIQSICLEQDVDRVVIGLPLRMRGDEGPAAVAARTFGERLRPHLDVPIDYWDERLSTVTAQQTLIEGGERREKRKEVVDMVAAQILLQHYLDSRPPPGREDSGEEEDR